MAEEAVLRLIETYGVPVAILVIVVIAVVLMMRQMSQMNTNITNSFVGVQNTVDRVVTSSLNDREESKTEIKNLYGNVTDLRVQVVAFANKLEGNERLIEQLNRQIDVQGAALQNERKTNGERIGQLEADLKEERTRAQSIQKKLSENEKLLVQIKADAEIAREESKRLQLQLENARRETKEVSEQRDLYKSRLDDQDVKLAAQDAQIKEQAVQILELTQQVSELKSEIEKFKEPKTA